MLRQIDDGIRNLLTSKQSGFELPPPDPHYLLPEAHRTDTRQQVSKLGLILQD